MTAVLVIGAGPNQISQIRELARREHRVLAVDRDPAAPGLRWASSSIQCSTHHGDQVVAALRDHPLTSELTAVSCPSTGAPYLTAAQCARTFGLPFPSERSVRTLLDKHRLWRALVRLGLTRRVARSERNGLDRPWVPVLVKPRAGGGASRGVTLCQRAEQLGAALRRAQACSLDGRALAEPPLRGPEYKVAGWVDGEGRTRLFTGLRTFGPEPLRLPLAAALGRAESSAPADLSARLAEPVRALCQHLDLRGLPLNLDVIDTGDLPEIIDVDLSLGALERLLGRAAGIDGTAACADLCLGRPLSVEQRWWRGAAATYLWLDPTSGDDSIIGEVCRREAGALPFVPDPWLRGGGLRGGGLRGGGLRGGGAAVPRGSIRAGAVLTGGRTQEAALARGREWLEKVQRALRRRGDAATVALP